jgi:probable HAF family extracellular repeat protein
MTKTSKPGRRRAPRRALPIGSKPLLGIMVVVVALAIGMAVVASAASVSLSPTTRALAATNENPLVGRELSATDLGTLRGRLSTANAINDLGQDVGISDTARHFWHAFLWQNGKMRSLGTPGGRDISPTGINNRGQLVGYSDTASGKSHAVLWSR